MPQNFNDVFRLLYNEFGEDLISLGAQKFGTYRNGRRGAPDSRVSDSSETETNHDGAEKFEHAFKENINAPVIRIAHPNDVIGALISVVLMAGEAAKFESVQRNVRVGIAAERDVAITNIEMQKALLLEYLDKSFDERRENFQKLFTVVDDALEKGDNQQLALGLDSILKLAESSPFKDLATIQATADALNDPDHQWDF
ncbi:hypothetical protein SFC07_08375 [Corynebacterium callunae]|uniref:hypothetical protein n=1 Tax=Corynebacterium callunae TaxID=1721 RepID=UPI0039820467